MKATPRRGMPDLSPVPAPLAQIADWHRAACRTASQHGLDMGDPTDHPRIASLMGWDPAPDPVPEGWRRRMTEADRLQAMQRMVLSENPAISALASASPSPGPRSA